MSLFVNVKLYFASMGLNTHPYLLCIYIFFLMYMTARVLKLYKVWNCNLHKWIPFERELTTQYFGASRRGEIHYMIDSMARKAVKFTMTDSLNRHAPVRHVPIYGSI